MLRNCYVIQIHVQSMAVLVDVTLFSKRLATIFISIGVKIFVTIEILLLPMSFTKAKITQITMGRSTMILQTKENRSNRKLCVIYPKRSFICVGFRPISLIAGHQVQGRLKFLVKFGKIKGRTKPRYFEYLIFFESPMNDLLLKQ